MTKVYEQTILEKLRQLPPERLAEVEDFVDFLAHRQADERQFDTGRRTTCHSRLRASLGQPRRRRL